MVLARGFRVDQGNREVDGAWVANETPTEPRRRLRCVNGLFVCTIIHSEIPIWVAKRSWVQRPVAIRNPLRLRP